MNNNKPANGHSNIPPCAELLDAVAAFFREYLVCDDHLLTLWAACTRFQQVFTTAPYLDIRSVEPCSGKTTCLNLLDVLCYNNAFLTGVPAAPLIERYMRGRCFEDPGDGGKSAALHAIARRLSSHFQFARNFNLRSPC